MAGARRRSSFALPALAVAGALVLLIAAAAFADTKSISMMNIAYNPDSLTIHIGDKVAWKNSETGLYPPQHTATSDDGHTFDSGYLNPGQSFTFTFNQAGTFKFHCNVHDSMHGTITVLGATTSPTPTPTHTRPKPTATVTAKPTVVPVSPTPTSSVKPSPRVSKTVKVSASPTPSSSPSRVVAAGTSSSGTGSTLEIIAAVLILLVIGAAFFVRRRKTIT
jgi:plastocyanin